MLEQLKSKKIKACNFQFDPHFRTISVDEGYNGSKGSIVETSDPDPWKTWTSSLPNDECRYGIYDVNMTIDMGEGVADGVISKIVLLSWSPDVAKTKTKMVYSRARQLLKEQLDGIQIEWQANDMEELEVSELVGIMNNLADIRSSGSGIITFENMKV